MWFILTGKLGRTIVRWLLFKSYLLYYLHTNLRFTSFSLDFIAFRSLSLQMFTISRYFWIYSLHKIWFERKSLFIVIFKVCRLIFIFLVVFMIVTFLFGFYSIFGFHFRHIFSLFLHSCLQFFVLSAFSVITFLSFNCGFMIEKLIESCRKLYFSLHADYMILYFACKTKGCEDDDGYDEVKIIWTKQFFLINACIVHRGNFFPSVNI